MRFGCRSLEAIVAVYERGLGFGNFIALSSSLPASVQLASSDRLLAQGWGTFPGLSITSVNDYVDATVAGAADQQQLGAIHLFVLIFFVAIAAANTLVMLTRTRSAEFALLRRTGGTRRQLASMIGIEAGFVMVMALAIGTLAVLPGLTGWRMGCSAGSRLGLTGRFIRG